jgi:multidrug efflux system membrane fusion protein
VVNEQENEARGPWGFVLRHKVAVVLVVLLGALVFFVVRNIHGHPQNQFAGRGNGGGRNFNGNRNFQGGGQNGKGNRGNNGQGNFNQNAVAVSVAQVTMGDINVRIPALGTIVPLQSVTVRSQISGQLQKIAFKEGQLVHAGDFLAQVDPRPYEATLAQQRGTLRKDQSLLADAKLDLKRFEELIKEDSVAQQQLDTQRALVEQYEGQIESDQAQIRATELNLTYCHIVSPVTGRVGLRQVDVGNYVTPGDTNGLVIVTQLDPITAIFAVPEDYVEALMQRVHDDKATLQVEAYDKGSNTKLAVGKLASLDNQIDTTTGTIKMRAQFDNKDGKLFPNQFVNIQLLQNTLHDQMLMPAAAVHRGAPNGVNSTFVYLVNADKTASVRPVKLGVADGETVAVVSGLNEGDMVVTEGGDRLRDGAPVELPADTPVHAPQPENAKNNNFRGRKGNGNGGFFGGGRRPPGANSYRPQ